MKVERHQLSRSSNIFTFKRLLVLLLLLVATVLTSVFLQNKQELRQRAEVDFSNITPEYHCLGLGGVDCNGVKLASEAAIPCAGLSVSTEVALNKKVLEQGDTLKANIVFKNGCVNTYEVKDVFIAARDPKGTLHKFLPSGGTKLIYPAQTVALSSELAISTADPTGKWSAFGAFTNASGILQTDNASVVFDVVPPCPGLDVSKGLTLDKTTVTVPDSITGTITYKNNCMVDYKILDGMISARDPNGSVSDFTSKIASGSGIASGSAVASGSAKTIAAGQEMTITGTRAFTASDIVGVWKAFGAYRQIDGVWKIDPGLLSFTVASAPAVASPSAKCPETACGAGLTCDAGNICTPAGVLNGPCRTARDILGNNPSDPNGIHGTCGGNLYCITNKDTSPACGSVGSCSGTCQVEPDGILNGKACKTPNKQETSGGCVNGSRCDVSKDTTPSCASTGACTGICVLR